MPFSKILNEKRKRNIKNQNSNKISFLRQYQTGFKNIILIEQISWKWNYSGK